MNASSEHRDHTDLIGKFLSGNSSDAENAELFEWLEASTENRLEFEAFEQTWNISNSTNQNEQFDVDSAWNKIRPQAQKNTPKLFSKWFSVAASILIVVLSSILFLSKDSSSIERINLAVMQDSTILLPDHSVVVMQKGSKLSYTKEFVGDQREITFDGVAFFEIHRNASKPFVIHTTDHDINVLGTSFTVTTGKSSSVAVKTGTVKFTKNRINQPNKEVILTAGERGESINDEFVTTKINSNHSDLFWVNRTLIFESTPLYQVIDVINKAYVSDILLKNDCKKNVPISTTFKDAELEDILTIIAETHQLKIEKSKDSYLLIDENCEN